MVEADDSDTCQYCHGSTGLGVKDIKGTTNLNRPACQACVLWSLCVTSVPPGDSHFPDLRLPNPMAASPGTRAVGTSNKGALTRLAWYYSGRSTNRKAVFGSSILDRASLLRTTAAKTRG